MTIKLGKFDSFDVISNTEVIKDGDKSFFDHNGTGIPKETYPFWDITDMKYPEKRNIILLYEGKEYSGLFRTDQRNTIRMFWHSDLAKQFNEHPHQPDHYPSIFFIKITSKKYEVILLDTPFSTVYNDTLENEIEDTTNDIGKSEGKRKLYYSTKYERNQKNRNLAIKHHGYKCMACGFDFEKAYGELGKGFIEVHHIKPLYSLEQEIEIDPQKDLICLCSNCHRMVHRNKNKVLSLAELRMLIKKQ